MLIPKCCKGCSNRNKGVCNCVLPSMCNEYVEDNSFEYYDMRKYYSEEKHEEVINGFSFSDEQKIILDQIIKNKEQENQELKEYTKELNNKLLNLQLFLKDLRDSFHKGDETYEEIDKKLKELGGVDDN